MPQKLLHYDVQERLGVGARSTIYRVTDTETGRPFALKHVVRSDPKDIRFIEQMEREYEISSKFSHPYLRRSYKLKIVKTMLLKVTEAFLVMELVEGKPLEQSLPRDMATLLDVFANAAEALKAMHQMGYVHADLKPNNIMRTADGGMKIIDFGQSCRIGEVKERIQGTPDFIAPEQVMRQPITIQTDVFNLGATLYWALCGKHIPTAYTVKKGGDNSLLSSDLIPTPQSLNPAVPTLVSKLVMECIASRPSKRPNDMDVLAQRLEIGKHIIQRDGLAAANPKRQSAPEADPAEL